MTFREWMSATKPLGGECQKCVFWKGHVTPLGVMSESEREEALSSEGWCQVCQSPMKFVWVREESK